jgi:hypothetical protein
MQVPILKVCPQSTLPRQHRFSTTIDGRLTMFECTLKKTILRLASLGRLGILEGSALICKLYEAGSIAARGGFYPIVFVLGTTDFILSCPLPLPFLDDKTSVTVSSTNLEIIHLPSSKPYNVDRWKWGLSIS